MSARVCVRVFDRKRPKKEDARKSYGSLNYTNTMKIAGSSFIADYYVRPDSGQLSIFPSQLVG